MSKQIVTRCLLYLNVVKLKPPVKLLHNKTTTTNERHSGAFLTLLNYRPSHRCPAGILDPYGAKKILEGLPDYLNGVGHWSFQPVIFNVSLYLKPSLSIKDAHLDTDRLSVQQHVFIANYLSLSPVLILPKTLYSCVYVQNTAHHFLYSPPPPPSPSPDPLILK